MGIEESPTAVDFFTGGTQGHGQVTQNQVALVVEKSPLVVDLRRLRLAGRHLAHLGFDHILRPATFAHLLCCLLLPLAVSLKHHGDVWFLTGEQPAQHAEGQTQQRDQKNQQQNRTGDQQKKETEKPAQARTSMRLFLAACGGGLAVSGRATCSAAGCRSGLGLRSAALGLAA